MDHDQRFKELIQEFLPEFFALFFPDLAGSLDFGQVIWLEQQLFPDPPQGVRLSIDLLAQVVIRPGPDDPPNMQATEKLLLLHIEIESDDTVEPFRLRMYDYYHFLSRKYDLDVLPIAVYLGVGLEGQGKDVYERRVLNRRPLRFEYDYVGLPGLQGERYLEGENRLGVAWSALMRWPKGRQVAAAVEALEKINNSQGSPRRKMMLCECIQAYAPLNKSQRRELTDLLADPQRRVGAMVKTWSEMGREDGQRQLLLKQLEKRFPPLSKKVRRRLEKWPAEKLVELGEALVTAQTLKELGLED